MVRKWVVFGEFHAPWTPLRSHFFDSHLLGPAFFRTLFIAESSERNAESLTASLYEKRRMFTKSVGFGELISHSF